MNNFYSLYSRFLSYIHAIMNIRKWWFTLMELIISILILVVISVTAFIIVLQRVSQTRDTNRYTDIASINKWIDLYKTAKSKLYPQPYGPITYGSILNTNITIQWHFSQELSTLVWLSRHPTDPVSKNNYIYWISYDWQHYQVAATLENEFDKASFVNEVYAAQKLAYVDWHYPGYIIFATWVNTYLVNLPSLLVFGGNLSGSIQLLSTWTYFLYANKINLPYSHKSEIATWLDTVKLMNEISPTWSWSLQVVDLTSALLWTKPLSAILSGQFLTNLWGENFLGSIWNKIGISQPTISPLCEWVAFSWYSITQLPDGEQKIFSKTWSTSNWIFTFTLPATCNAGTWLYGSENTSLSCNNGFVIQSWVCVPDVCQSTVPPNGSSNATSQTITLSWTYNTTPWVCTFICNTHYSWNGSNACTDQTAPTITNVSTSSPACNTVRITINWANDAIALHSSPYSFDGGSTWQSAVYRDYSTTSQTISANQIKVRDQAGNIYSHTSSVNGTSSPCTVSGSCNSLPANSRYYGWVSSYSLNSAPPGTSLVASYASSPASNTCQYNCAAWYNWDGSSCQPIVNWSCWSAATNYAYNASAYAWSLCNIWSASPVSPSFPSQGWSSSWSCQWSNWGSNASCSASRANAPINWSCSWSLWACSVWSASWLWWSTSCWNYRTWSCSGQYWWSTANCSSYNGDCPENWSCSWSLWACSVWSPSWLWWSSSCWNYRTWTCYGYNGWSNASCSYYNWWCPVNGSCWSSWSCSSWSPWGDNWQTSCWTTRTWTCYWSNGWSNASCSQGNWACCARNYWQSCTHVGYHSWSFSCSWWCGTWQCNHAWGSIASCTESNPNACWAWSVAISWTCRDENPWTIDCSWNCIKN